MITHPDSPFRDAVERHRRSLVEGARVAASPERPVPSDGGAEGGAGLTLRPTLVRI